jgi:hypothetical protein
VLDVLSPILFLFVLLGWVALCRWVRFHPRKMGWVGVAEKIRRAIAHED